MTTKLLLFAGAVLAISTPAQNLDHIGGFMGGPYNHGHAGYTAPTAAFRDPLRKVADRYYNITPLFQFYSRDYGNARPPMPPWTYISGRSVQSAKNGLLMTKGRETIFIRNYPYIVPDGHAVQLFAMPSGTFDYTTVLGAKATVIAYDYGTPYTPAPPLKKGSNAPPVPTIITNPPAHKVITAPASSANKKDLIPQNQK